MGSGRGRTLVAMAQALAIVFAAHAQAEPWQSEPQPTTQAQGERSVATALSNSDRLTVSVTIAGAGPYWFIVDTGAERSVIARELADALALRPAGRSGLLSLTTTRDVAKVELRALSFLPGETHDLQAFALSGADIGASGILGIDALRGQRVVFDFEAGTLSVGPAPHGVERIEPDEIVVHARRRFGQLVLADSNVDGIAVDVIIDSGSQVSVGNDALRRLLTTTRNIARFEHIALVSVTGETLSAEYTRANRFIIGSAAVIGMPIAFSNAHVFIRMGLTRRPALLLGMDALQMFARVSVDFPNRQARFVLPNGVTRTPDP